MGSGCVELWGDNCSIRVQKRRVSPEDSTEQLVSRFNDDGSVHPNVDAAVILVGARNSEHQFESVAWIQIIVEGLSAARNAWRSNCMSGHVIVCPHHGVCLLQLLP